MNLSVVVLLSERTSAKSRLQIGLKIRAFPETVLAIDIQSTETQVNRRVGKEGSIIENHGSDFWATHELLQCDFDLFTD